MINFDDVKESKKRHTPNWQQILDHPYRVLITGGSGSGKTSIILSNKSATRYWSSLRAKDPYEKNINF